MAQCNIQELVDSGIALQKIIDYADTGAIEPTVDDYEKAGIEGVDESNIDVVNQKIDAATKDEADTIDEIQDIVNSADPKAAAISKISDYADDSSLNPEPTVQDYIDAGVEGVTEDNLSSVNQAVDAATKDEADTVPEIQELVQSGLAIQIIADYADDSSNPTPTVANYEDAGVVGVTADNLVSVNKSINDVTKVEADTVPEIQAVINQAVATAEAVDEIATYAQTDGTSVKPTVDTYDKAGVDGVTPENVGEINAIVASLDKEDVDTASEVQAIVAGVIALNKIEDYAESSNNETPSVADYIAAGVIGVTADNLDDVNAAVAAVDRTDVDTLEELQAIVNNIPSASAVDTISEYAETNGTSTTPTKEDYENSGVDGVTDENLSEVNEAIAALEKEDVDTATEIQDVVASVNALNKIEDYADSNTNDTPTVSDYEKAGVIGVTSENLDAINQAVDTTVNNSDDVDTKDELQALINSVSTEASSVAKIAQYADTDGKSEIPSEEDYSNIGTTIPSNTSVEDVNEIIATLDEEDVDTAAEIQDVIDSVSSLNKIEDYAEDNSNDTPTVQDYIDAGVVGVTSDNLDLVNAAVDAKQNADVDTVEELQAVINDAVTSVDAVDVIAQYAESNGTSQTPISTDYTNSGVTIPENTTVDEVNEIIASLEKEDVDTAAEIQDIVDSVSALNTIEDYANSSDNTTPSVEDYETAGVVGVTVDNIDQVNLLVDSKVGEDVDTVAELQALINGSIQSVDSVDTISSYAETNGTSQTPTELDYEKAGVNINIPEDATEEEKQAIIDEINEVIAQLEGEDVDTSAEIQDVIDSIEAGNKIEEFAKTDGISDVPNVEDYEKAGVTGVTEDNLEAVNNAIKLLEAVDVDTKEEIQEIVNSTSPDANAVDKISEYAQTNGTSQTPSAEDYEEAGVDTGIVDPANPTQEEQELIDEINEAIAALDKEDVDTAAEIADVISSVVALNKIEDYADDNTNSTPTVADYETAGVIGVTSDNLDYVNAAVDAAVNNSDDVDTVPELQELISKAVSSVDAIDTIANYAESNGTSQTPLLTDYTNTGISIPENTSIEDVNEIIATLDKEDVDTASEIQDIVDAVSALNKIEDYADDSSNETPTVLDYETAGIIGVTSDNLDEVNGKVDAKVSEDVDTVAELQALISSMVDSVKPVETISNYAESNGTSTTPTTTDYEEIGVDGVDSENIDEVNEAIAKLNKEDVDTASEIQDVVESVNAINTIEAYATDDTTNTAPTVEDYEKAGVVGVTSDNLDEVNAKVAATNAAGVDTKEEIQSLINSIDSVDSVDTIASYADSNGTSQTPDENDYTQAGVDIPSNTSVKDVNEIIATLTSEDVDSSAEIQDIVNAVSALNTIEDYADDNSNITPTVQNYIDAGIVGVTSDNLDYVNGIVDSKIAIDVDTVPELQALISNAVISVDAMNTIVEYANTNGTSEEPTVTDYNNAGVNIPEDITAKEINEVIETLNPEDVDTAAEIQDIITSISALNTIEDYADDNTNTKPSVADYESAGVVGVTEDNLDAVNTAVDAKVGVDVDTKEELQALINKAVSSVDAVDTITNYAQSNGTSEEPDADDYSNAGVTIPEGTTIKEINEVIASLNAEDVNTASEIQDIITSIVALNKIEDYADDNTNSTPTVADYEAAGVVGVTADNLDNVNEKVDTTENNSADVDTVAELQALINSIDSVDAVDTITSYADTNGTSQTPSETDYTNIGVTIPSNTNVDEINEIIASLNGEDVDTASEVQAIITGISALNVIEDYAQDGSNTVPTLEDYEAAGVVGVTEDNLDYVNAAVEAKVAVDVDTKEELQALINSVDSVESVDTIVDYANTNGTSTAPTSIDYANAGVTIPENTTVEEVNEIIATLNGEDVDTATEIEAVIASVSALNKIEDYADDNTNATPSVEDYSITGVVGVTSDNLDLVNNKVDLTANNSQDVDTVAELQALVNTADESVDAVDTITNYADTNGTSQTPDANDYTKAGVTIPNGTTVEEVNEAIAALVGEDVDTQDEIQSVIDAVVALNVIEDYADEDTAGRTPTVADYVAACVVGVTEDNLSEVNAAVDAVEEDDVDTVPELQVIINNIASVGSVDKISNYAQTDGTSTPPTATDYYEAGVSTGIVDPTNPTAQEQELIDEINEEVAKLDAKDVDTKEEINAIVEEIIAINVIEDYANNDKPDATIPEVSDYEKAGVTGVTSDNIDAINALVDALEEEDVDTSSEIQALVNSIKESSSLETIKDYANNNGDGTTTAPSSEDYENIGVDTGIVDPSNPTDKEQDLIDEINTAIAQSDIDDVDTPVEIQDIVKSIVSLNKIEDYADDNTNSTPTVADYESAGVIGVTSENISFVNAAVDAATNNSDDVDTVPELQALINSAVATVAATDKIANYADDTTNPIPELSDYTAIGVDGVDSNNIDEVNEAIAALEKEDADTAIEVQAVVEGVNAINTIEAYATDDSVNPAPSVEDYEKAGVIGVTADNLDEVNAKVAATNAEGVDTKDEIQTLVNSASDDISAIDKIVTYAEENGQSDTPDISDYETIGVDGIDSNNIDEVNEAIAKLNKEDVDTSGEIQDIVTAVNAINIIEDYADSDKPDAVAPSVEDYANAGVVGVTSENLDAVNAAVDAVEEDDVDTKEEIQALISSTIESVNAIDKITTYAEENGTSDEPTITDYANVGVTLPSNVTIDELNDKIASLNSEDVDTASEIVEIIAQIGAFNTIEDYADDNTNTAPTVEDYTNAGVIGVNSDNLADVNQKVDEASGNSADVDTLEELQALVNTSNTQVAAVSKIEEYASTNGTSAVPTQADYENAGVDGVNSSNLDEINDAIAALQSEDVDTAAEIQDIVTSIIALNKIEDYATDNNNDIPTVEDYENAGVVGVTSDNIDYVNSAVDLKEAVDVDTVPELQAIINNSVESAAAVDTLVEYANTDGTSTTPTLSTYSKMGVDNVNDDNIDVINEAIASLNGEDVDTAAEVQDIVSSIVALNKIEDYAEDNTNSTPTVADYEAAGVVGVTSDNIEDVNDVVDSKVGIDVDTVPELQAIINNAVDSVDAVNTITEYANTNGTSTTPTSTDFANAGVTIPNNTTVDEINEEIAKLTGEDVDTALEIQELIGSISALNKIEDYADDNTNATPTVDDYAKAGVVGVTADNLNSVNAKVDEAVNNSADVDTVPELQALVNTADNSVNAVDKISTYAQTNGTSTTPSAEDYKDAGVSTGVVDPLNPTQEEQEFIDEINEAIAKLEEEDVDTAAEIAEVIASIISLNKIEDYANDNTNATPTVADYEAAGVVGVTSDNLNDVNKAVDEAVNNSDDVDTVPELQALINSTVSSVDAVDTISQYAESNGTSSTPTSTNYVDAGVDIPANTTIEEVNEVIATLEAVDVDSASEIQDIVNAVSALNKIEDYAEDNTNATPSVVDYATAGVVGVTEDNLDYVNSLVDAKVGEDVDTTEEVQALISNAIDSIDAIDTICTYAQTDGTSTTPTASNYTSIGVNIPENTSIEDINEIIATLDSVDVDTAVEIQDIIDSVSALNTIEDYADNNTNITPTVQDYIKAGIVGVSASNIDDVNGRVDTKVGEDVDTVAELQAIVNEIPSAKSMDIITNYASSDGTSTVPVESNFTDIGVEGITSENIAEVNEAIAALQSEDVDTVVEIEALIQSVDALNIIENYADSNTNTTPTVDDYAKAGVVGVTAENLDDVNAAVDSKVGTDVDTVPELQALISSIVPGVEAIDKISTYADTNGTSEIPTASDYENAGVSIPSNTTVDEVNEAIAVLNKEDVDTSLEIADVIAAVSSLNTIENYAEDSTNPVPTVEDYNNVGIIDVTADNIDDVNIVIESKVGVDVDTVPELQAIIDALVPSVNAIHTIANYADTNGTSQTPTIDTYSNAGVTIPEGTTIDEVNERVASLVKDKVDSASEIADVVASVVALNKIEAYAADESNPVPSVEDYATAKIMGVRTDNLEAINEAIKAVEGSDADTIEEVQAIANAADAKAAAFAVIAAYVQDSVANPAPETTTYADAGINGVTEHNLGSVNKMVDEAICTM